MIRRPILWSKGVVRHQEDEDARPHGSGHDRHSEFSADDTLP